MKNTTTANNLFYIYIYIRVYDIFVIYFIDLKNVEKN